MNRKLAEAGRIGSVWPVYLFAISLGIPFTGWIREVFGDSPVGRLTFQDLGYLLLLLTVLHRVWQFRVTWDVVIVGCVNVGILLSVLANSSTGGIVDVVIHAYLFFFYFVLRNILDDPNQRRALLRGLLVSFYVSLAVAVLAKFVASPFLPQVTLALQGSFLNGSQYGSFISVIAVPLYAAYFAHLAAGRSAWEFEQGRWTGVLMPVAIVLAPVIIFYTGKRSAVLSLLLGVLTSVAILAKVKPIRAMRLFVGVILGSSVLLVVLFALYGDLIADLEYLAERFLQANQIVAGDGFFMANVRYARDAFLANPLFGQGYGAPGITFLGMEYEVHSTYMKWLGNGGLVTAVPGALLLFLVCRGLYAASLSGSGGDRFYLLFLLVFFLGLVVAMAYAYLPRRREFWVVVAYLVAIVAKRRDEPRLGSV